MKKWSSLFLAVVLLAGAFLILPVRGEAGVYDNVIRLHVLANSDSEEDQALKLTVRDAVLEKTEELLGGVGTRDEAEAILRGALPEIEETAARTLAEKGCGDGVAVTLSKEKYPRRTYEGLAFPAGEYLSLQVKIGRAEGHNWWCVLFPPMCLSAAAADRETVCLSAGLTEEQYRLITESESGKYKLRFKILEVAGELFGE